MAQKILASEYEETRRKRDSFLEYLIERGLLAMGENGFDLYGEPRMNLIHGEVVGGALRVSGTGGMMNAIRRGGEK